MDETYPTKEALAALRCPFECTPFSVTEVPTEQRVNTTFVETAQPLPGTTVVAPWSGYYCRYERVIRSLAIIYGVWFEIRKQGDSWKAFRVARLVIRTHFFLLTVHLQ